MSVKWVPKCAPIKIDKLSVTIPVSDSEQAVLQKTFQKDMNEYWGGKAWDSIHYHINKKIYLSGESVLFQGWPKMTNSNWMRLEFNPAKVDPSEVGVILNSFYPGGYQNLISYGSVTRIDFAIDVKLLQVEDLIFQYPGVSISQNHLKAGRIQTAYLGDVESENSFIFYDKVEEIKTNNNKLGKNYKVELPKVPTTRIEWRYRPGKNCTLKNLLSTTKNRFEKLNLAVIRDRPKVPKIDFDSMVRFVIHMSRYEGLQQALYHVPKPKRQLVKNTIIQAMYSDWWKPSEIWQSLPAALEPIINPKLPYG